MMEEVYNIRLKSPMPTCELKERQSHVQEAMKKAGIDVIIASNVTGYMGGLDRYLSDTTAEQAYTQSILIGQEGSAHILAYGGPPQECYPPRYAIRGCTGCKNRPYFSPFSFTHDWEAQISMEWMESEEMKGKDIKVIGFEPGLTHINISDYLAKVLPGVTFVDASNLIDEIRGIKSKNEREFLKDSSKILDKAFGSIIARLYDGVREFELRNEIERILTELGGEEFVVMIGSAPHDGVLTQYPTFLQNRVIHAGDQVYISVSSAGAGGMYTKLGRMFSLGEPSKKCREGFELAVEAEELIASMMRPGMDTDEILAVYNHFLTDHACLPELGIFAHGQGYDFIERPSIQNGETMKLAENMCMAVQSGVFHPLFRGYCADSYFITKDGAKQLSLIEKKIFIV